MHGSDETSSVPEDGDGADVYALSGENRVFALALIHSDHSDEELRQALRWGRRATLYPPRTVLSEFAAGSGTLAWGAAIRAALAARQAEKG